MMHWAKFSLLTLSLLVAGCGGEASTDQKAEPTAGQSSVAAKQPQDLVSLIAQTADLSIMARLVRQAQPEKSKQYTIFVPSDSAFDKMSAEQRSAIIDGEMGRAMVLHHLVRGKVMATDFAAAEGGGGAALTSLDGTALTVRRAGQYWVLSDAAGRDAVITTTDIVATNGVIHIIDTALTPG